MLLDKNACEEAGLQSLLDENTPHRRSRRGYQRSVKSRLALVEVEIRDTMHKVHENRYKFIGCCAVYPSVQVVSSNSLLRSDVKTNIVFSSLHNRVQMSRLRSRKQT
jgi:hypothetical protein